MENPLKRIGLILISLFLFPAIIFTAIEINALNESERVLENIYQNQLESILLSINRFSDDVLNDWTNDLESKILYDKSNSQNQITDNFLKNKNSLKYVFTSDSTLKKIKIINETENPELKLSIENLLFINRAKIRRLFNYLDDNYRKLEPLDSIGDSLNVVIFTIEINEEKLLFGYLIKPEKFIDFVLSPKIQEVAREDIVIKSIKSSENKLVYSTDKLFDEKEISVKKEFWLFPNYEIGISIKGESLEEIVKSRSYFNLSLLGGLNFLLIIAVFFLYRSIRKEIHLAQLKSEFVSNVSHELRTPLALISMFAETLELGRVKTEVKKNEYYTIISQEAQRLSKIVNLILNFSKMESGKRNYNLAAANINDVVEKVISTYEFHLRNKGFSLEINLENQIPEVSIDEEAISECIINLIDNGVKYSKDDKRIVISTEIMDSKVRLNIKDFGIGINKGDQKKIFEKFYRVPSNLVHNTKGTGLGLSIVSQIMKAHNGNVEIKSSLDKGSIFTLSFPVKKN